MQNKNNLQLGHAQCFNNQLQSENAINFFVYVSQKNGYHLKKVTEKLKMFHKFVKVKRKMKTVWIKFSFLLLIYS